MLADCARIADAGEDLIEEALLEGATQELSRLMQCAITDGCQHAVACRDRIDGLLQLVQHAMREETEAR
ncbi:MAG: hypothetical protein RIB45_12795 [Marivibrio sp.]|uniref:hypothetical protein n=1 Tax=Marivibrio sp. TaxID=2039719 RepID=UPI0032F09655